MRVEVVIWGVGQSKLRCPIHPFCCLTSATKRLTIHGSLKPNEDGRAVSRPLSMLIQALLGSFGPSLILPVIYRGQ